jgi:hypothetical protein
MAFNGSPRKKWNTATPLEKALEGASSQGAETELIHLYDLNYKGCISCFACKTRGGKSYGRCAVKDDLTPLLNAVADLQAFILGSPIYYGTVVFPLFSLCRPAGIALPGKSSDGLHLHLRRDRGNGQRAGLRASHQIE